MPEPQELKPNPPAAEHRHRVTINLGSRRYAIDITAKAHELKPKPADVVEISKAVNS